MDEQAQNFLDALESLDRAELHTLRSALQEIDGYTRDTQISVECAEALEGDGDLKTQLTMCRDALKMIRDISTEEWTHHRARDTIAWAEGEHAPDRKPAETDWPEHWY